MCCAPTSPPAALSAPSASRWCTPGPARTLVGAAGPRPEVAEELAGLCGGDLAVVCEIAKCSHEVTVGCTTPTGQGCEGSTHMFSCALLALSSDDGAVSCIALDCKRPSCALAPAAQLAAPPSAAAPSTTPCAALTTRRTATGEYGLQPYRSEQVCTDGRCAMWPVSTAVPAHPGGTLPGSSPQTCGHMWQELLLQHVCIAGLLPRWFWYLLYQGRRNGVPCCLPVQLSAPLSSSAYPSCRHVRTDPLCCWTNYNFYSQVQRPVHGRPHRLRGRVQRCGAGCRRGVQLHGGQGQARVRRGRRDIRQQLRREVRQGAHQLPWPVLQRQ